MNHGKDATLVPLLRDPGVREFDILAIQEPWRNPFTTTSYCPSGSDWYLAYPTRQLTRVCFYINKRLNPEIWAVTDHSEDAQTLTIKYNQNGADETIAVHNIYNPSPGSYTSQEQGTLGILRNALEGTEEGTH